MSKFKYAKKPVRLSQMHTPQYQRDIVPRHPILKHEYDEAREGQVTLSRRDGKFWIIDGLQRKTIKEQMIKDGLDLNPYIDATIYFGMTEEDEAKEFVRLNADRKGITAFDSYNAGVRANLPEYLLVKDAVESVGLVVGKSSRNGVFQAITPVLHAIKEDGLDNERAKQGLRVLATAFPGQSLNSRLVEGMMDYLRLRRSATINETYMVKRLGSMYSNNAEIAKNSLLADAKGKAERHYGKTFMCRVFGLSRRAPLSKKTLVDVSEESIERAAEAA